MNIDQKDLLEPTKKEKPCMLREMGIKPKRKIQIRVQYVRLGEFDKTGEREVVNVDGEKSMWLDVDDKKNEKLIELAKEVSPHPLQIIKGSA